jgi:hypothetical protein
LVDPAFQSATGDDICLALSLSEHLRFPNGLSCHVGSQDVQSTLVTFVVSCRHGTYITITGQ